MNLVAMNYHYVSDMIVGGTLGWLVAAYVVQFGGAGRDGPAYRVTAILFSGEQQRDCHDAEYVREHRALSVGKSATGARPSFGGVAR